MGCESPVDYHHWTRPFFAEKELAGKTSHKSTWKQVGCQLVCYNELLESLANFKSVWPTSESVRQHKPTYCQYNTFMVYNLSYLEIWTVSRRNCIASRKSIQFSRSCKYRLVLWNLKYFCPFRSSAVQCSFLFHRIIFCSEKHSCYSSDCFCILR